MQPDTFVPPQNKEAEMSVLGAIFMDDNAVDTALEFLKQEDFYREAHRKIFNVMCLLGSKNEPCDLVTVTEALKGDGCLEEVGGAAYLCELIDFVPTAANVAYYCKIVAEKSLERRLLTCNQTGVDMIRGGKSSVEVVSHMESALASLTTSTSSAPVPSQTLIMEAVRRLKQRHANKGALQGMSWGLEELDDATTGIQKGDLIIVAGRPSMGKTALVGNIIRSVCDVDQQSGMIFSLEMSRMDCTDRMIADVGNVKYHHLRTGQLENNEWPRHAMASQRIGQWNLHIDDTSAITLGQIRSRAKKQKRSPEGLHVLAVDYLQLMGVNEKDNRVQSLGGITRGLKQLARELDIAVILLSQLNRSVDARPDKRPLMSDLRDSGEIEQDADVILFPFRPAAYCPKCKDKIDSPDHDYQAHMAEAQILVGKQRNGESNLSIPVEWMGAYQRFACLNAKGY